METMVDFLTRVPKSLGKEIDEKKIQEQRQKRKDELLSLLTPTNNQSIVKFSKEIDELIDSLAELSPISNTKDVAKQLEKTWSLIWTTEKEINLFIEQEWSTNITQQILDNNTLVNNIPFVNNNGFFGVQGRIFRAPGDPTIRTQFVFERATLSFNRSWLPAIQFPPVGKGWFDTVYLDENFRVDRNSRNDILVCRSLEK